MKQLLVLLVSFVIIDISLNAQVVPTEVYSYFGALVDKDGNKLTKDQLQELPTYGFDLARYEKMHMGYSLTRFIPGLGVGIICAGALLPEIDKKTENTLYITGGIVTGTTVVLSTIYSLAIEKMTYDLRTSTKDAFTYQDGPYLKIGAVESGFGFAFVF